MGAETVRLIDMLPIGDRNEGRMKAEDSQERSPRDTRKS